MADVTIYTTGPGCIQCKLTRDRFDDVGIVYEEVNIREVAAARDYVVEELGYMQAPVVVVEDGTGQDHWSGFLPDQINRIAKRAVLPSDATWRPAIARAAEG